MDADSVGRWLIVLGGVIALTGITIIVFSRLPFLGRLPQISFEGDGFAFFFPIGACIVLSLILTIAANIAIRLFR
jgi:hypothetical protein